MKINDDELVIFQLARQRDTTGVSGTGCVAYGIRFPKPNKRVALGWVSDKEHTSTAVYDDLDAVERIHGHNGDTVVVPIYRMDTGKP